MQEREGQEARGLITSRDITERKEAEAAIRASEERFKSMADLLPCAIVELDQNLTVTYVNQAGMEMFGYTPEDFSQGIQGFSLLHRDELPRAMARIEKHNKGVLLPAAEYRMIRKDGSEIPVLWNSTPIRSRGVITGFRGTVLDLTTLKFLQGEAFKAQKMESIGTLAGGIAHDFNNLLMGLSGNLSLAKAETDPDSPLHELIESAERSLGRAKHLTTQLLTFAKGGEPVRTVMTLDQVIRETAAFNLSGSSVKFEMVTRGSVRPVNADKGQIGQVVANLVINARQAMPDGGVLRITLANRTIPPDQDPHLAQGDYVSILFEDQGVGIPKKHLERIFDPYFTTKQTGSGLGMTIVHSIVTKHQGRILADSEMGKGTRFEILLPALDSGAAIDTGSPPRTAPAGTPLQAHILVMDDDPVVRDVSRKMLMKLGCTVALTSDGKEAVERYREALTGGRPFDAVIMDLTIPGGMGGKETLETILAFDPGVRGIAASGYSMDPIMSNFQRFGFKGIVMKPYHLADLRMTLTSVLRT
jgi:PAS domain S-box-containing protein